MPGRDPITTAELIVSLDLISGGRVVYGVASGWNAEEMATHGGDPTRRGAVVVEHILAMKEIWHHDEAEFHGDFVDFDTIYSWPKPVQRPDMTSGYVEAGVERIVLPVDTEAPDLLANLDRLVTLIT